MSSTIGESEICDDELEPGVSTLICTWITYKNLEVGCCRAKFLCGFFIYLLQFYLQEYGLIVYLVDLLHQMHWNIWHKGWWKLLYECKGLTRIY